MKPKVAFIGTGGTISSVGTGPLDIEDYSANNTMLQAGEILDAFPSVHDVAEVIEVAFSAVPSPSVDFRAWKDLWSTCADLAQLHPDLSGIVIGHGTASLEETAYFLGLPLKVPFPVVLVGSQRPLR